jgi:hypothetical protein
MPVPPHSMQKLQQLQMQIDALPRGEMLRFPVPDQDMLLVTGVLVQTYSYIEFNLRRCVETFVHAKVLTGPWARKPTLIQSARLVGVVKEALVQMTPAPAELPDWTAKLDEISLRWSMRHMFAHWAIRRVPNEDYIILMTNDGREVKRLHKLSKGSIPPMLGLSEVRYALMDAADARGVCEHMVSYENWIAQKAADWYKQFVES